MKMTQEGMNLLTYYEGCELEAYKDGDAWAIGYGTRHGVTKGMVITPAQAQTLLLADIQEIEDYINHYVVCPLNDNEFSALVCFIYNIGWTQFRMSKMHLLLNRNLKAQAANQFSRWVHIKKKVSKGLKLRRKAEKALFLRPMKRIIKKKGG